MENFVKLPEKSSWVLRFGHLALTIGTAAVLSGCNVASHYESVANVGDKRVELTPLLNDDEIAQPATKAEKNSAESRSRNTRLSQSTASASYGSVTPATAASKSMPEVSDLKPAGTPVVSGKQAQHAFLIPAKSGATIEDGVAFEETFDKGVIALEEAFRPNGEFYRSTAAIKNTLSARCRRILAQTGLETTILRSPSISANLDDDANFGMGASFDFVDLKRANLKEELALAQCYRAAVGAKLGQLIVTSNQSLTRAGFLAKARTLKRARGKFARIRRQIRQGVESGSITLLRATTLQQYLQTIQSGESRARGEANRREAVDQIIARSFKNLDKQLAVAEQRIHDIDARMRTVDAIKIRGQVSYGDKGDFGLNINDDDIAATHSSSGGGSFNASVHVSVKLGAFYERRHQLEEVLRESKVAQHSEDESGILWRTTQLAKANNGALKSLRVQRADLVRALREAQRNTRSVPGAFKDDMLLPQLRAEIDIVNIRANLAAIDATIADTKRLDAKLRFRS